MKPKKNNDRMLDRARAKGQILRRLALDMEADRDRKFMLDAVAVDGDLLRFAAPELQDDRRVVLTAAYASPSGFSHASERLKADRKVVKQAVKWWHWHALADAAPELRRDPKMRRLAERRFDEIHACFEK